MQRIKTFVDSSSVTFAAKFFFMFGIIYTLVVSIAFLVVVDEWKQYASSGVYAVEKSEAHAIDVCDILQCEYINIDGSMIYRISKGEYDVKKLPENKVMEAINSILTVDIPSHTSGVTFGFSLENIIKFYANAVTILYSLLMILSLLFLVRFLIKNNINNLVQGASTTASLHNKNMAILAEQLHHELNTPLSVVKELCDKIFVNVERDATCGVGDPKKRSACDKCEAAKNYSQLSVYKRIIDNNIKQAFVFIERMADVKQIRYSNGNKSVYDITKATFDVMGVFNRANYSFDVDQKLRGYTLDHASGLQNHELMNILLNHIKNSLEAGSSHIFISLNKIEPPKKTSLDKIILKTIDILNKYNIGVPTYASIVMLSKMLSPKVKSGVTIARIALIDNGSGIPKEFQANIFNLNTSTKTKDGVIRGAGLYLNRQILRDAGGDIWQHDTSGKGTTFILDVPVAAASKEMFLYGT